MNIYENLSAIIVLSFDFLTFSKIFTLKKDTLQYKFLLAALWFIGMCIYVIATNFFGTKQIIALAITAILGTIVFWLVSKYKGARFFMTYTMVNTGYLVIMAFVKFIPVLLGYEIGHPSEAVSSLIICAAVYIFARPHLHQYKNLMTYEGMNWHDLLIASIIMYAGFIFFCAYPSPMVTRIEYVPSFLVLVIIILWTYVISIKSIIKSKNLYDRNVLLAKQIAENEQLQKETLTDNLTGLGNRKALRMDFNEILENKKKEEFYLVMMDIDKFKNLNDTFGHQVGDEYLKELANAMTKNNADKSYRFGGDEFCMIVYCEFEQLKKICSQISSDMTESSLSAKYIKATCSFGAALWDKVESPSALLERADQALYKAKEKRDMLVVGE